EGCPSKRLQSGALEIETDRRFAGRITMKFHALLAAVTIALASLSTPAARANIVFNWTGTCFLTCTGTATAVLTLADGYVFGSVLSAADFVSLTYNSSDQTQDITSPSLFTGGLNADGSVARIFLNIRGPSNFPQFAETDVGGWMMLA